jgi:UDP-galactopyranose mutase
MTHVDYLVIGSGLTGASIARLLVDAGREVLVLERRSHLGGNVHDFMHPSGIRVHTYGPHYFRCTSKRIWDFVNRFARFIPYSAVVKCRVGDHLEEWPINQKRFVEEADWPGESVRATPANFEEACLQRMPRRFYETFVRRYTRRQWGIDPQSLGAQLIARIRVNGEHETSLTPRHRFQGLPDRGYAQLMKDLLEGIPRMLGVDYLRDRSGFKWRRAIIFTGPIDEFFGFDQGRLGYRGQKRVTQFLPGVDYHQPCAQVNHSDVDEIGPIRTIEWKHLMPEGARRPGQGTILTEEFPFAPGDPDQFEYPLPTARDRELYACYRRRADLVPGLVMCGRLGEYRYLDMDHAIGRAMLIAGKLLHPTATRHNHIDGALV